jgi:transposase
MNQSKYYFSKEMGQRVYELMQEAKDLDQYKRMQAVYFRIFYKEKAPKIAERTGLSIGTIWNIHGKWKRKGFELFEVKNKGGRIRENLSFDEEKDLLKQFENEGKEGGILEVQVIHEAYQQATGKNAALSTTYRMLERHNWRKIMPRPRHPKGNPDKQADFKKSGQQSLGKHVSKQKKLESP